VPRTRRFRNSAEDAVNVCNGSEVDAPECPQWVESGHRCRR
jgi:hypothetical protein